MTWLTLVTRAAQLIQRIPQWAWGVLVFLVLVAGVRWVHLREVDLAVHRDRIERARIAQQELDSLLGVERKRTLLAVVQTTAQANAAWAARDRELLRSRSLERQLATSQQRLTAALAALPDSTARQPGVATLVQACTAVAQDCGQLRTHLEQERAAVDGAKAATREERKAREDAEIVADSALQKASERIATEIRRREDAEHRPTRTQLVVSNLLSALLGYLGGKQQ